MTDNFRVNKPFDLNPPRLRDLVNEHVMGDVWVRDLPFEAVTDSLILAKYFDMPHAHMLRAIDKCKTELGTESKYGLCKNLIENKYLSGPKGRKRDYRKVDVTEFGLTLLLLYINSPKARKISAEILYRFFVLKTYVDGLSENQLNTLKEYYRQKMKATPKT
jgi:phage regulator Rha-like protein